MEVCSLSQSTVQETEQLLVEDRVQLEGVEGGGQAKKNPD